MTTTTSAPTTQPRYVDAAELAKLVRSALRSAFPGIKFSVRSSRFSTTSAVDVHWTDGPTVAQVDGVLDGYRQGKAEVNGEAVIILPRYLGAVRTLSADFRALLLDDLTVALGVGLDENGMAWATVDRAGNIAPAGRRERVAVLVHQLSQSTAVTAEREVRRAA